MTRAAAQLVAVLGAESTGKTLLAQALAEALGEATGRVATWVPEHLRAWCDAAGRTPARHEQAAIAQAQQAAIEAAMQRADVVVCDTTPLMTAVYSRLIFGDTRLDAMALAFQRRCDATLVTAPDLPWVADGLQRDGPHVQGAVDALLAALLAEGGVRAARVTGRGPARLRSALRGLQALGLHGPRPARRQRGRARSSVQVVR